VQGTELLEDQESEDDAGPVGAEEILQSVPEAYAAQRSEINLVIEQLGDLVI
jgi:hypothetical protein